MGALLPLSLSTLRDDMPLREEGRQATREEEGPADFRGLTGRQLSRRTRVRVLAFNPEGVGQPIGGERGKRVRKPILPGFSFSAVCLLQSRVALKDAIKGFTVQAKSTGGGGFVSLEPINDFHHDGLFDSF